MQIPLEYKTKRSIFLGREFFIDKRVHIPRKNTEPLVKLALVEIKKLNRKVVCADIGTGAGVIAISLALGNPLIKKIYATDAFAGPLAVARKNIKKFNVKNIKTKKGNLFGPLLNTKIDIIIANLPHASEETFIKKQHLLLEPKKGTLSGKTGLEMYDKFLFQLSNYKYLDNVRTILIKISPKKSKQVKSLIKKHFPSKKIKFEKDYEEKVRFVKIS